MLEAPSGKDRGAEVLAQRGAREGVRAGAQHGDEQRGLRNLASARVMEGNGVAGPVHKHLLAGAVFLAQHHVLVTAPAIVQLTEAAVAVAIRLSFAILFPDQLQRQVLVRLQLPANFRKIGEGPNAPAGPPGRRWKQQFFQPPIIDILRQRPGQTRRVRFAQISVNGRLTDATTAGDLILL